jgi:hypothetical protein
MSAMRNISGVSATDTTREVPVYATNNALDVNIASKLSGEDVTNDLIKVEQRFSYSNLATNATTTIKSGAGFLHSITINTPGATSTATVYDSTAGSGTKIATINSAPANAATLVFNVLFSIGLTVVTAGGTPADLTVVYR